MAFWINATAAGLRGNECQQRSEFLARSLEQIAVDTVQKVTAGDQRVGHKPLKSFPFRGYRTSEFLGQCHLLKEVSYGQFPSVELLVIGLYSISDSSGKRAVVLECRVKIPVPLE